jgi:hypothetical protein
MEGRNYGETEEKRQNRTADGSKRNVTSLVRS